VGRNELPRCTASISGIADPGEQNSGAVDNLGFSSQFHLTANPQEAVVYQNDLNT
ncbi:uncharacterized protein METZ01_LOCUS192637, partial [marine metagenome]